jgi:hypothetical protein
MKINPAVKDIFAFRYEDFTLEGYDPHPHIKAEVAVCAAKAARRDIEIVLCVAASPRTA